MHDFDAFFMRLALGEASEAASEGEVPTGCLIVAPAIIEPAHDGHPPIYDWNPTAARILARAHNRAEGLSDATAHAEMLALSTAFQVCGNWRLSGSRLYVTKEPCPMCAGAISLARVETVVWGLSDPKRGGGTVFGIFNHPGMNHRPETIAGVLEEESRDVMQGFFKARRIEREAAK